MKYFIFPLAILCLGVFPIIVVSIDCPNANALNIPKNKILVHLSRGFHAIKYIAAPNFAGRISFPANYDELSDIRYHTNHYCNDFANNIRVFTSKSPQSADFYFHKYKYNIDPHLPILEIVGPYQGGTAKKSSRNHWSQVYSHDLDYSYSLTLKVALVYIYEETDGSFSIFKSCDGKYAWAQIDHFTITKLVVEGKDPFTEFSDKMNSVLNTLNIENGVIYNTTNNHLHQLFSWT